MASLSTPSALSFVVRTFNEAAFIGRLLDVLTHQRDAPQSSEVIVVDSGSTDATVGIAQEKGARLLHIAQQDFDYSKALNRGIESANGEFVVILSAHSIPCDSNWLASILAPFDDLSVAGVYSRQVPWPQAPWWESRRVHSEFGEVRKIFHNGNSSGGVPFSNAASCIRRVVWEKRPFLLPTGEDGEWATWAVAQGYKIVYEARTAVFHSHHETCRQAMRRVIEFEKAADIRLARSRTLFFTVRQALGRTWRDLKEVCHLKNATQPRPRLAWESITRGYWFLRDFRHNSPFRSPVRQDS
jgi:glycosyltransferase involved in cell wall biosynthesis